MPAIATQLKFTVWCKRCGNRAHGALLQVQDQTFVGAGRARDHHAVEVHGVMQTLWKSRAWRAPTGGVVRVL